MTEYQATYMLHQLEEIRHLLAENLLVNARIYDNLRWNYQIAGEDPTYETTEEIVNNSQKKMSDLKAELDKLEEDDQRST